MNYIIQSWKISSIHFSFSNFSRNIFLDIISFLFVSFKSLLAVKMVFLFLISFFGKNLVCFFISSWGMKVSSFSKGVPNKPGCSNTSVLKHIFFLCPICIFFDFSLICNWSSIWHCFWFISRTVFLLFTNFEFAFFCQNIQAYLKVWYPIEPTYTKIKAIQRKMYVIKRTP